MPARLTPAPAAAVFTPQPNNKVFPPAPFPFQWRQFVICIGFFLGLALIKYGVPALTRRLQRTKYKERKWVPRPPPAWPAGAPEAGPKQESTRAWRPPAVLPCVPPHPCAPPLLPAPCLQAALPAHPPLLHPQLPVVCAQHLHHVLGGLLDRAVRRDPLAVARDRYGRLLRPHPLDHQDRGAELQVRTRQPASCNLSADVRCWPCVTVTPPAPPATQAAVAAPAPAAPPPHAGA